MNTKPGLNYLYLSNIITFHLQTSCSNFME